MAGGAVSRFSGKKGVLGLHPSHLHPMRNTSFVLVLLVLGLVVAWALPPLPGARGIASYLPLHTLLETIAIIIAALVFAAGWNANVGKVSGNFMLLACAFLGVGLLDFAHVLSYAGMPDFVTPSGPEKAIDFWLAARALAAAALFGVAVTPWRPLASTRTRYILLTAVLTLVAAVLWLFLFHGDVLPETFIPGKGLTSFKVDTEYAIILLNLITALALWVRMGKQQPFNVVALFGAVCVMALSEFFFTLYADVTDIFNLLGHIYKVISYLFIYSAIYVVAIEDPYRRLSESQNQQQATLDALPDLLYEVGLDGHYQAYHAPRTGLMSLPDESYIGKSLTDTLSPDAARLVMSALHKADQTGHSSGEYAVETPQGRHWLEFSVARKPVDSGHDPRFIVLSRDVTERRRIGEANSRLAERLELATRAAHIGIWDWDIATNELVWDDRMFELYGVKKGDFGGAYEAWVSALHPDDRADADEAIQMALRGENPYDIEFRVVWPEHRIRHIRAMGQVVRDAKGGPLRMIGVNYDITARKEAEERLMRINEELEVRVEQRTAEIAAALGQAERANAAKSEFLSRMSHELRTPLNAILGFGQLLEVDSEQPLSESQADDVKEILQAGNHLLELINEVLDLARIESGKMEISLESVDVTQLIEACVAQLRPLAVQRGITVEMEPDVHGAVLADQTRFKEVLINLLSNAIKYNREGGAIQIRCTLSGETHLRISVRDTGRGIAADALPRLFKPFERLESAYDGIEGTGIGLALAKKLVEAMHGEIGVESEPGEGSTFWFDLPLAKADAILPASASATTGHAATHNARRKILYVEDNAADRLLVQKLLVSRTGLELLDAASAEAGLALAFSRRPDLILLDIGLPAMGGLEALRKLRDNPHTRDIPVIAVTARAMLSEVKHGKAAGFTDYLTKPIDVASFFDLIDSCLPGRVEDDA